MLAETRGINNGIKDVNAQLGTFGKTAGKVGGLMKGAFVAAGAAVAGAKVADFLKDSVTAASDLNEVISKTNQVFGAASPAIMKFASTSATSLGLSKQAALEGLSAFGNFFNQIGIGAKQSAAFSKSFVKMSADLASFNNANPADVMEAFQAATRGEYDSLQKYIPTINAAKVQQEALRESGKKHVSQLTDQDKAIALHTLAVKGLGKANGDFARTSGGLANQQRILSAQFTDLKAKIGTALLPVVLKVVSFINSTFIPALTALGKYVGPIGDKIKSFFDGAGSGQSKLAPVVNFIKGSVIPAVKGIIDAYKNLATTLLPIVQQIVAGFMSKWNTIKPALLSIWNSVKQIITSALSIIQSVVRIGTAVISAVWSKFGAVIIRYLSNSLTNAITILKGAFKVISGVFKVVSSLLKGDWKGAWNGIKQILSGALDIIKGLIKQSFNLIRTVISAAWIAIKVITKGVWSGIKAVISGVLNGIKALVSHIISDVKTTFTAGWNAVKSATSAAWNGIKSAVSTGINAMLGLVKSIPGKVKSALGSLGSLLYSAGKSIIQGLLDGIESMIGAVESKLSALTSKIPDWKGPKKKDANLLREAGRLIIKSLIKGFDDATKGVKDTLGKVTDIIEKHFEKGLAKESAALTKRMKAHKATAKEIAKAQKALTARYKSAEKAAKKSLGNETKHLMKNAKKRQKVYNQLANAQQKLADLKQAKADYAANVKSAAIDALNITNLNAAFTPQAMIQQMTAQLQKLQRFADLVKQLKKQGLNQTAIDQIVQAGVEGGLATAEAIASGGQEAISQFNSLQSQINTVAGSLGDTAASSMYDAGIKAAEGLVAGLQSKAKELENIAKQLAHDLVQALNDALDGKDGGKGGKGGKKHRASNSPVAAAAPKVAAPASNNRSQQAPVINVYPSPFQNPAAVGREVAKSLDAYYAEGGRRKSA